MCRRSDGGCHFTSFRCNWSNFSVSPWRSHWLPRQFPFSSSRGPNLRPSSRSSRMSDRFPISRRALFGGALLLALERKAALAQGFAGLGMSGTGFAPVLPDRRFVFPADHGPHPDFRIEWWYVTANLTDANGTAYGAQWTLFRQAMYPGPQQEGWANQQIWMGHSAITRADVHHFSEAFAR